VLGLEVHADASFLPQFRQTGRSIVGSLVLVGGVAVKATSNLTSKTLLSTHETEVAAANLGRVEGNEVGAMLRELGVLHEGPYKLFCDNESVCTVAMAALLKTSKSRMIWGQHHRLREEVTEGTLVVQSIPSGENLADFLTKRGGGDRAMPLRRYTSGISNCRTLSRSNSCGGMFMTSSVDQVS
jgi:hypothetical protein